MTKILETLSQLGTRILAILEFAGFTISVLAEVIFHLKNFWFSRKVIIRQMYNAGVRTFIVVSIVALFTGMILALQSGIELMEFGLEEQVGNLVISTLSREMAPFVASIILIAAVGSAMAAEIGTMKVSEELDALEIMSINSIKFLVMPRVVALAIMLPVATIYSNILGVVGGAIVAKSHLNVSYANFYLHVLQSLHFKAVYVGLFKSFVFGLLIASVCCAKGLRASNGALGVGKVTRDSVVVSFLLVLIIGYFITEMFYREGL